MADPAIKASLDCFGAVSRGRSRHRPRNAEFLFGGPYPFIQTGNITHSELYISEFDQTYSEAGLAQSKEWPEGTLCIVNAGVNTGDNSILAIRACFPDSVIGFQADPTQCEVRFIKYYLDSIKTQIRSITMGATQDNLSVSKLLSFKIPRLPLDVQRKIAGVLSAYDDLLEVNRKRINALERIAEETYREWFVRMRFPGYSDAKFKKGLPTDWSESRLGDIAEFTMGQSPKSEFYNTQGDGLPFNQGVGTYGIRFPERETYCSVAGRTASEGDILFSVRAPVGRLNIADCKMTIGRGLAAVRHRSGLNSYLFYLLKVAFSNEDIIGNGAIFNSVGKGELERFGVFAPPPNLVTRFDDFASSIDRQIKTLLNANSNLVETRDALSQRLMSGQTSVAELDVVFPPNMQETRPVVEEKELAHA